MASTDHAEEAMERPGEEVAKAEDTELRLQNEWDCQWEGVSSKLIVSDESLQLVHSPTAKSSQNKVNDPKRLSLPWLDILGVEEGAAKKGETGGCLILHHIHKKPSKHWQPAHCRLAFPSTDLSHLVSLIKDRCQRGKPRRLLVFINPVSGLKTAGKRYRTKAAPVFQLASIETDVQETKGPKDAEEIPMQYDLSTIDGIVVVGGDGFYYQVLNGLLRRAQKDAGADLNDKNATLHPPPVPIGLLPGGTGNRVSVLACGGVMDTTTAALHIARGVTQKFNIFSVYSQDKFLAFSGLMTCYGGWSDMLYNMESKRRSLGVLRLPVVMLGMAFKRKRTFKVSVEYLQVDDVPSPQTAESGDVAAKGFNWKKLELEEDTSTDVLSFASDFQAEGTKIVLKPSSSGVVLTADKPVPRLYAFKDMVKLATLSADYLSNPSRKVVDKVVAWRMRLLDWEPRQPPDQEQASGTAATSNADISCFFNVDGELLRPERPEAEVWLHPGFLPIFTSCDFEGREKQQPSDA